MPLAVVTRSGTTPSWSQANQSPVRAKPVWISSAMKRMPLLAAPVGDPGQPARRRDDEAALALDRLDEHRGAVVLADLGVHGLHEGVEGLVRARLDATGPAVGVGHRGAVDLTGERTEAVLVGHVLRRQRHREVGPAVVGVVEHDDRVAAGVVAGDLDGVLHRLGPGVEQRRALLVGARGELGQLLADLDVLLVGRDHEAGVGEVGDLPLDRLDHARGGVADGGDGDAGAEVDELVAVDVDEDAAAGPLDVDRAAWCRCRPRRPPASGRAGPASGAPGSPW